MKTGVQQIMLGTVTGSRENAAAALSRIKGAGYDGIELNRDGNAKRMILQGFDSWFVMNLLSVVANS